MNSDFLKSLANRFAREVNTNDGAQIARLFRIHSLLSQAGDVDATRPFVEDRHKSTKEPRVGIWQRAEGGRDFVRRWDQQEEWHFWANVGRIPPKGARRRVVLAGESVARGYFYDPQFSLCDALRGLFKSALPPEMFEVVDLARTSIGVEVAQLACDALVLEPDVLVMFAGNNWWWAAGVDSHSHISRSEMLRHAGVRGLKELVEQQHAEGVREIVGRVSRAYREHNIPVVWVVPEFNLGDWRDALRPAPLLMNGKNGLWMDLWAKAQRMVGEGNIAAAKESAQRMVELDGGTAPAGLYILGDCHLLMGDAAAARTCFALARDATICETALRSPKSPRAYTVTQGAMRAEAEECADQIVDLPTIFLRHLDDGLPDRRLFLDYCHLSAAGMQVAVAAIGICVARLLASTELAWSSAIAQTPLPSSRVQAEALLLAAIHNAHHWNQRPDLISSYCRDALKLDPQIANVMKRFIEFQTRSTPVLLSTFAEALAELPARSIRHYLLRENSHQFDPQLLDNMILELSQMGSDAGDLLATIRLEEHSAARRTINLLEYYYSSATCPLDETYWTYAERARRAYHRAYSPVSKFIFVGEAGRPVLLRMTCRAPHAGGGPIQVEINGVVAGTAAISSAWQTLDVEVAADAPVTGLNEIVIRWPLPQFSAAKCIDIAAEKWLHGEVPEIFCVFGEIHSLIASPRDAAYESHWEAGLKRDDINA